MSSYGLIGPLLAANASVRQPALPISAAGVYPHPQVNRKYSISRIGKVRA